ALLPLRRPALARGALSHGRRPENAHLRTGRTFRPAQPGGRTGSGTARTLSCPRREQIRACQGRVPFPADPLRPAGQARNQTRRAAGFGRIPCLTAGGAALVSHARLSYPHAILGATATGRFRGIMFSMSTQTAQALKD